MKSKIIFFIFLLLIFHVIAPAQKPHTVADSRLKKNIVALHGGLASVLKIRGVTYEWKTKSYPQFLHRDGPEIGFVAQEMEEIEPLLVDINAEGFKSVDYERVSVLLVEAIKEQQQMINHLKKQLNSMQNEINTIKNINKTK